MARITIAIVVNQDGRPVKAAVFGGEHSQGFSDQNAGTRFFPLSSTDERRRVRQKLADL
ncbi:MAG: hypothetical protein LBT86_00170 [Deltaproteobacteria bacterium]|nr:hypothetical protein [Deltaproteobacteria bacterium]